MPKSGGFISNSRFSTKGLPEDAQWYGRLVFFVGSMQWIENGKKRPERNAPRPRLSRVLPDLGQTGCIYSRHQTIEHVVDLLIVVVHRMGADPEPDAVA